MKQKTGRKLLSFLLALAMLVGLMPGMSMTAYAAPTETLLTTITATGTEQASYSTANVATVSFSNLPNCSSVYSAAWGWWGYGWTATVNAAKGDTITKCVFYDDANRKATDSEAPFVVETTEDDKTPLVNGSVINSSSKGIKKIDVYGYATPTHTHDFTYSASGATITATCKDTSCALHDSPATLTLSATDASYTGSAYTGASLSDTTAWTGAGLTAPTIEYAGRGSTSYTKSTTAPRNAGTYTASITVDTDKTATADFTITPATLTNVSVTQSGTLTYTGSAQTPAVTTAATAVNNQTVTFTYSKTSDGTYGNMPTVTDVADGGTFYYKASAPNHSDAAGSFTVTMNPKSLTPSLTGAVSKVYDGGTSVTGATANTLSIALDGVISGDDVSAAIGSAAYGSADKGTGIAVTASGITLTGTKAGNYSLSATTASANVGAITVRPVTITAKDQTVELNDSITTYAADNTMATMTGAVEGHTLQSVMLTPSSTAAVTTEGTITPSDIVIQDASNNVVTGNYTITPANGVLIVTLGQLIIDTNPTATAITYGQTLADSTFSGGVVKDKHGVTVDGSFTWKVPATKPSVSDSGSTAYGLVFTPNDTANYDPKDGTLTVTVNPKPVALTWADTELTYDGTAQKPTASVSNLETGDEGKVSVTVSGEQTNANAKGGTESYTAAASELTGDRAGNYTLTNGTNLTQTFTIAQKSISGATVELNLPDDLVFDGNSKAVSVKSVTLTVGDTQTTLAADSDYTASGDLTGTDAGSYTVTVTGTGNYKDSAEATWAITIAPVTIATLPTAADITYGQTLSDSALTGGVVKLGDNVVEGTFAWKEGATKPAVSDSETTLYPVVFTPTDSSNYATAECEVTLTVNKAEGGGNPSEKTLVYDGTAQELVTEGTASGGDLYYAIGEDSTTAPTFYIEGTDQVDTTKWNTSVPKGTDAGTYYVWYKVKGDANHNDTKPVCVEATIAKKGLTVTADAKSKTQGEADPALTYTAEGLVAGDTLTGALSREAGEDPGTYAINLGTLTAGDNYVITFVPATLTINKAPAPDPGPAPAPAPAPSSGGGGGYYGGGTVQNQRRDAYSDVIGAAETNFRDSSPERIRNIELACEKLDGIVLQPGEVFSFNEALGGLTAEDGFAVAPVNPDDEATAEMGGGVSQVASTLYTGSLFALLETVERTNHPYAVPFIQPGTDAYVTDPGNADALDLKFRNTRGEPIRISAKTRVDEARQVREIVIELQSALGSSDYMPIRFDNTWGGDQNAFLTATPYDLTRPGYRILLTHEEQAFTDNQGAGIRTLTHRKILDAAGMLVRDEILNQRLSGDSYAMDTYYTKG